MLLQATVKKRNKKTLIALYSLMLTNLFYQLVGYSENDVDRAEIGILYADDEERNRIRTEQLRVAEELNQALYPYSVDESMMTPYGPSSPNVISYPIISIHRPILSPCRMIA